MTIEELQLEPIADHGARLLQQKYHNIEFTSGRRTIAQQAHAMAEIGVLKISRHLTGRAFDVRPVMQNAEAIKADIRALPGLNKFLEKVAGHVRWHAQFQ